MPKRRRTSSTARPSATPEEEAQASDHAVQPASASRWPVSPVAPPATDDAQPMEITPDDAVTSSMQSATSTATAAAAATSSWLTSSSHPASPPLTFPTLIRTSKAALSTLARVEVQSIMHFLSRQEIARLARCSRRLLRDGDQPAAWKYVSAPSIHLTHPACKQVPWLHSFCFRHTATSIYLPRIATKSHFQSVMRALRARPRITNLSIDHDDKTATMAYWSAILHHRSLAGLQGVELLLARVDSNLLLPHLVHLQQLEHLFHVGPFLLHPHSPIDRLLALTSLALTCITPAAAPVLQRCARLRSLRISMALEEEEDDILALCSGLSENTSLTSLTLDNCEDLLNEKAVRSAFRFSAGFRAAKHLLCLEATDMESEDVLWCFSREVGRPPGDAAEEYDLDVLLGDEFVRAHPEEVIAFLSRPINARAKLNFLTPMHLGLAPFCDSGRLTMTMV